MAGPAYIDSFRLIRILPDDVTIAADAVDDTLTLVAGPGISLVANAGSDQITIVNTNPAEFSFGVAGDDSSIKTISSGETVRFAGAQNVTVSADSEGAITITGPDLSSYLTSETDPVYTASSWYTTTNNSANWDAAYSWGDHAGAGYLTSIENDVTIGSIRINTNLIQTVDSNADLELDANGTGAVSVIGNLKVSGVLASSSTKLAIGSSAGETNQGVNGVAIGALSGQTNQGLQSVAVGNGSGNSGQGLQSVAIGNLAGSLNQGQRSVAIGSLAGASNQGEYAVALGNFAGGTNQPANSIIINATGVALNGSVAGLFIDPIRNVTNGNLLTYDTTTKEITYTNGNDLTIGSIRINTNVIQTVDSNANLELAANGSGIVKALDYFELSDGTSPQGAWTGFTPTWTAATSNPTVGDGLIEGRYKMVGKTVHVWMMMTMGSTTTFGTGEYKISLPVAARAIASVVLDLVMYDNGTRHYNSLAHNDYTTSLSLDNTSVTLFWDTGIVTHSAPFTWADGDWFIVSGTYEAD